MEANATHSGGTSGGKSNITLPLFQPKPNYVDQGIQPGDDEDGDWTTMRTTTTTSMIYNNNTNMDYCSTSKLWLTMAISSPENATCKIMGSTQECITPNITN